jgi:phage-related protein
LTVLDRSVCGDCGRIVYERGGQIVIEAARRPSGEALAENFLADLDARGQYSELAEIAIRLEDFALNGTLTVPLQLNNLGDGIFEIKTPTVRLAFYYAQHPGNVQAVRLTNGFFKRGRKTPPRHIRLAKRMRAEDQET